MKNDNMIKDYLNYVRIKYRIDDTEYLDWLVNVLEDNTDFLEDNPTFYEIDDFILGELESLEN